MCDVIILLSLLLRDSSSCVQDHSSCSQLTLQPGESMYSLLS